MQFNSGVKTGGLPKKERLASSLLFEAIYKQGRHIKGRNFVLNYKLVKDSVEKGSAIRVAFVVSKKVSKLAVCRNKIKRQMREAYRFNRSILLGSLILAIRALPTVVNVSYNEIESEIKHLFEELVAKESCNSLN